MTDHTHEWSTKYRRSTLGDFVEIYCVNQGCNKKMTWTEAKRRINTTPDLLEALRRIYLGTSERFALDIADETIQKARES